MEFKEIVKDWQAQFPILSPYTPPTLFAKAGIVLIGLRLDKVMSDRWYDKVTCDRYRVILQILPLWVEKDKIQSSIFQSSMRRLLEYLLWSDVITDRAVTHKEGYYLQICPEIINFVEKWENHGRSGEICDWPAGFQDPA